jgi:hypothetical protein
VRGAPSTGAPWTPIFAGALFEPLFKERLMRRDELAIEGHKRCQAYPRSAGG